MFDQTANILHDLNSPQQRASIRQMLKDSSSIGAQKLVAALTKLLIAQRLNQFSLEDMFPLIQSTLAQLQRQLVTSIVNSQQEISTNSTTIDSAQLKQLIDMLENYDAQAIDLIGQMYDVNNGTDQALLLGQARKLVAKYDFESALELLTPLISDNE